MFKNIINYRNYVRKRQNSDETVLLSMNLVNLIFIELETF